MLLTRAPVAGGRVAAPPLPLDLHVLSLSLAFILSQDQTLRCWLSCLKISFFVLLSLSLSAAPRSPRRGLARPAGRTEVVACARMPVSLSSWIVGN